MSMQRLMKQVIQPYNGGDLEVVDVPPPADAPGALRVATSVSLISSGTERHSIELASRSLAGKAAARPDLVEKVLTAARRDGLKETVQLVRGRLAGVAALGYSLAGKVVGVGEQVRGWRVGDRVACAGQNYASHAEVNSVPEQLCVPIPDAVSDLDASFVAVGAIALQGVRQAAPALGETVAVIGLGLVGQLACRLLAANGCQVIATDPQPGRCDMAARSRGVSAHPTEFARLCEQRTAGYGVDAVLVTAASKGSEPVVLASQVVRKRGRVVVVGDTGLDLPREPFYLHEIDLRFSTSYGPGRYDPEYEEQGRDYPYAYVRWTERRNMTAFLDLLAAGRVAVDDLVAARYTIEQAAEAFDRLCNARAEDIALALTYGEPATAMQPLPLQPRRATAPARPGLAVIGAGSHVQDRLLPRLQEGRLFDLRWVCGRDGVRAARVGQRFGVDGCTTSVANVLDDPAVAAVLIGTRHDSHAQLTIAALEAGKHVYVEKPLCLTLDELDAVIAASRAALADSGAQLMVGFNRRYSCFADDLRAFFDDRPIDMLYRVNAQPLPATHWLHDPSQGGGRLVGEACHFADFMSAVCQAGIVRVAMHPSGAGSDGGQLTFGFADGSSGALCYTSGGARGLAKERFEAHGGGRSAELEDFFRCTYWDGGRRSVTRRRARQMGFDGALRALHDAVRGSHDPAATEQAFRVSRALLLAQRADASGTAMDLP